MVPTDYKDTDSDNDGVPDKNEPTSDTDGDGIPDRLESATKDTDGDGKPNQFDSDDDGDGIPTRNEDLNGDGNWANDDKDKDGIPTARTTRERGRPGPSTMQSVSCQQATSEETWEAESSWRESLRSGRESPWSTNRATCVGR